jgi:hypothetical protein
MFRKINRELMGDVITQQVAIYKYVLDKTKVNMYGESSGGKFFDGPVLLNSLITIEIKQMVQVNLELTLVGLLKLHS